MRSDIDHTVLPVNYTIPRKRSPDVAATDCSGRHLIAAYYTIIDPENCSNTKTRQKDERLSCPRWLTYRRRFTKTCNTRGGSPPPHQGSPL